MGSATTQGRPATRVHAAGRVAFRSGDGVGALVAREDFGVGVDHPGGHGVGGSAQDDLDAGLAHGVDDRVHPGVFKVAVLRLPEAPGGLAHADDVDAGGFHQGNVFFQAGGLISWHVLVVVGRAVKDGGLGWGGVLSRRGECSCEEAYEKDGDCGWETAHLGTPVKVFFRRLMVHRLGRAGHLVCGVGI